MSEVPNSKATRVALFVSATLIATAVPCTAEQLADGDCIQFTRRVVAQVAKAETKEAEAALSAAFSNQAEAACAGLNSGNVAAIMLNSGRPADAETFAAQSVSALGKTYSPDNPILLRPLQILCSARFQLGRISAARETFERVRAIQANRPEDRALVHALSAMLMMTERKHSGAEAEYLAAAAAFEQAGRLRTADAAANFAALASLYIRQQRYQEARAPLDRAWDLFTAAKDSVPRDLINILAIRAILYTRLAQWAGAERDLSHAMLLADHERQVDPGIIEALLKNYAVVLRKTHRQREVRRVEDRVADLEYQRRAVVDVTELLPGPKLGQPK